jgi:pimeloyl-ACP methyl ester carboxylesterase
MTGPGDRPTCRVVRLNPHRWNGRTIVMTHGAWHTVRHYLTTFDDRPGWAYDFALAGYRVLLADYPGTGGSPRLAHPELIDSHYICRGLARVVESAGGPVDLLVHSMSGPYGYALLETHRHVIDHLVAVAPAQPAELADRPDAWDDLGDRIRTVYGGVPWEFPKVGWTHGTPEFVATCIGTGTRFPPVDHQTYLATLSPLRAELSVERLREVLAPPARSVDLAGGKVLVLIGTHDAGHPREFGVELAGWLTEHGAEAELLHLGDRGVHGNGHMLMLEDNSSDIAAMIMEWLER